jgi:hypothetical protein
MYILKAVSVAYFPKNIPENKTYIGSIMQT